MGDSTTQKVLKERAAGRHQQEDNMTNRSKQGSTSSAGKEKDSQKKTNTRPKPVFFWTNADVLKWLRRHCQDYHTLYASYFLEHDITGRSLVRMNDTTLEKIGISDKNHRDELCREIWKLKLKSDILEMKDLERKGAISVRTRLGKQV